MDTLFKKIDFQSHTNNTDHHTNEISTDQLVVRRGQHFVIILDLLQPFNPDSDELIFTASTGEIPEQDRGTLSVFGIPDSAAKRSQSAKAVWKVEFSGSSVLQTKRLMLYVKPPADAPIGKYTLSLKAGQKENTLGTLVVLFNPWCPDDWVFLPEEKKRQEYVMNEQGIIYKGSTFYVFGTSWDFGQFEDEVLDICLKILDLNHKHENDPADDVSARCNPIYVSRVISAMINSEDDYGVLMGRWYGDYSDGHCPTSWSSSVDILMNWYENGNQPVKYGQCWVFAAVMCTVMRCLGIPCRVVTNFQSAHDTDQSLTIDVFHGEDGVEPPESSDSVWNFHVWTEGWMRRPDLAEDGSYDGWQVLDPTPQEPSEGLYCCGPASVKAILNGDTHQKYDVPFVFAEVNADCVDWLIADDGSKVKLHCDSHKVGHYISTKCVGSDKRHDITKTYKHLDHKKEREVFKYACRRNKSREAFDDSDGEEVLEEEGDEDEDEEALDEGEKEEVSLQLEEVSTPVNGQDVELKLLVHSSNGVSRPVSINISVQAMKYTGTPAATIQKEKKEETLQADKDLCIPIRIPFSVYRRHMEDCNSIRVSAVVKDKDNPENVYLVENDIVLEHPPLDICFTGKAYLYREASVEILFKNLTDDTLKDCVLTVSGSGLLKQNVVQKLPELQSGHRARVTIYFCPHKIGKKTLLADFDCSLFRDIKGTCTVNVLPYNSYPLR
ncbi:protein-glutamine gamma-glutamyltransferase E-like [Myripristis murdjan]|uniref:protein-glutamine gamma-glutamyltransferase E-like n=1 Tax=Myripristis murdjan TaxID=586833 RepID=UPI0011763801|nr:protein-glutamine gamma-glutamyltransferase E-like [Myripristis murdjan]